MSDQDDNREQKDPAGEAFTTPAGGWPRKEPVLGGFDEDEPLEEPDRDNDYNTLYSEVDEEDLDTLDDASDTADDLFTTADVDSDYEEDWEEDEPQGSDNPWPSPAAAAEEQPQQEDTWPPATAGATLYDEASETVEEEEWEEEEYEEPAQQSMWPLGMIAVAALALVLLAAGGYGVMEQRSAMQEEIRQLQASLATSASPEEVAASREAVSATEQRNAELQQQVDNLTLENRQLKDTVAGLEGQLSAQQEAMAQAKAAPPAPKAAPAPKPAAEPKPTPRPAPQVASGQGWFVNFGSYGQQATAESWTTRLKPAQGEVVVTTGSKDGRTFYRVRVVNLSSREDAEKIARQLEKEYSLDRLWVGRQ